MARFTLLESNSLRIDQLVAEINQCPECAITISVAAIEFFPPLEVEIKRDIDDPDQLDAIQAVVTAHVPQNPFFEEEFEVRQADVAREKARELLHGLARIDNIVDFGYAYEARLLAVANGENMETILGLVDRSTAQAYITSMSQWANLTAAQRQWLAVDLESRAYDAMVMRLVLLD